MDNSKHNIPIKMGDFSVIDSEFNSIRERFDAEMKKMEDEMNKFRSELINRESPFSQRGSITSRSHSTSEYTKVVDGRQKQNQREEKSESFSCSSPREHGCGSLQDRVRSQSPKSPACPANTRRTESNFSKMSSSSCRQGEQRFQKSFPSMLTQHSAFNTSTQQSSTQQQQQHSAGFPATLAPLGGESRTWLDSLNSPLIQNEGDQKQLKLRFDVSQYKPEEIIVKTVDNKLMVHAKHEEKSESRSVYREYNREFLLPAGTNPELIKSSLSKDGVLTVEAPLPAAAIANETRLPISQQ